MLVVEQIAKFRDEHGNIIGYRLRDFTPNRRTQDVKADILKREIRAGNVTVTNLTLTSNNRLVDTSANGLESKKLGPKPELKNSSIDVNKRANAIRPIDNRASSIPGRITSNGINEIIEMINDTNVLKSIKAYIKYINEHPEELSNIKNVNNVSAKSKGFISSLFVLYVAYKLDGINDGCYEAPIIDKNKLRKSGRIRTIVEYSNLPNCKMMALKMNDEQINTIASRLIKYAPAVCTAIEKSLGKDTLLDYLYKAFAETMYYTSIPNGAKEALITTKGTVSEFISKACVKHDGITHWYNSINPCTFHLGNKLPYCFTEIAYPTTESQNLLIVPHAYINVNGTTNELELKNKSFNVSINALGEKPRSLNDIAEAIKYCRKEIANTTKRVTAAFEDSVISICGGSKAKGIEATGMEAIGNVARAYGLIFDAKRKLDIHIDTDTDMFNNTKTIEKFRKILEQKLNTI